MGAGVVIVGGGHGGSQVAASLRMEGYDGPIAIVSDETELPYHKPPLSKTFLKTPDAGSQMLRPESFYRDKAVDLMLGVRAEAIDRHAGCVRLSNGTALAFDHLVLATGARPRMPALPGIELAGVLPLRSFADAARIRDAVSIADTVAIVGGGFIGMEIAHTLAALGKAVTLVEMAPRVLGRSVAPAVSQHARARALAAGIDVRVGMGVTALEGAMGHVNGVKLADAQLIAADLVIIGTGVVPDTQLAADAGLAIDDGIAVNEAMRSSDPRILAIGDVARFRHWQSNRDVRLESVQNATDQARHAARTILGRPGPYRDVAWFWSDLGDDKLQTAGLSFDADRHVVSGNPDEDFSVWHFAGTRLVAVDSINRAGEHMVARKLLAAAIDPTEADIHAGRDHLKELAAARPI